MEPQQYFPGIDVNAQSWRYMAIASEPRMKRPKNYFRRGQPVVCRTFNILDVGFVAEVKDGKPESPQVLMICQQFGRKKPCHDCFDGCGDRYWALADSGGVLAREDLERLLAVRCQQSQEGVVAPCQVDYAQLEDLLRRIQLLEKEI